MATAAPPEGGPDIAALVAELRAEFFAEARGHCRVLLRILNRPLAEADRKNARQITHRWAGLGGTLGYPEVTRLAREVEQLLCSAEAAAAAARLTELARLFDNPPPAADLE